MPYGPANLPRLKAGLRRETMTALKPLSGLAEAAGVDAKLVVEDVPASVAILKASEQNNASLIVMAAQPHSWWQKLVGANTVKCVSQKARCPVVVLEREEKRAKESNKLWRTPSNLVESWKQV
jgi:nucleotide-binding universal stress UspA family protein